MRLAFLTVRSALAALVLLAVLAHAAAPAVPGFVCLGMGGAHRLSRCCPPEEPTDQHQWTRRCCVPSPPPATMVAWSKPAEEAAALGALFATPARGALLQPPPAPPRGETPLPRAGAPPGVRSPESRRILRI